MKIILETGRYSELRDKLVAGNTIYLENTLEDIAIKSVPVGTGVEYFARFKGGTEYRLKHNSKLLAETWMEAKEITAEEYKYY